LDTSDNIIISASCLSHLVYKVNFYKTEKLILLLQTYVAMKHTRNVLKWNCFAYYSPQRSI